MSSKRIVLDPPDSKIREMFSIVKNEKFEYNDYYDILSYNFEMSVVSRRSGHIFIDISSIDFPSYVDGASYKSSESLIKSKDLSIQDNNEGRELHNSVLSFFIGLRSFRDMDVSFEQAFGLDSRNNESLKRSPDFIWMQGREVFVLEVKTSMGSGDGSKSIKAIMQSAYSKYALPSYYLKGFSVKIGVVLVCRNSVHTNLSLNQDDLRMLLAHYHIGIEIAFSVSSFLDKKKIKSYKTPLETIIRDIGSISLPNIPINRDLPYMNRNYIRDIFRPEEETDRYLHNLKDKLFNQATKEIIVEGSKTDEKVHSEMKASHDEAYKKWNSSGFKFHEPDSTKSPFSFYNMLTLNKSPGRLITSRNTKGIISATSSNINFGVVRKVVIETMELEQMYRGGQEEFAEERMRHRDGLVKINLTQKEMRSLELRGVYKIKDLALRKESARSSKKIFSSTCLMYDLKAFLDKGLMNMISTKALNILDRDVMSLISQGREDSKYFREDTQKDFEAFASTSFGNICLTSDRILHVIICAAQNTHGKSKGSFIIKKVPELPIFVIMKVTTPSKNFVCSILSHSGLTKELEIPFGQPSKAGVWNFYDFKTLDRHRAFHLSFSFQKMFALMSTFCELRSTSVSDFLSNPRSYPEICSEISMTYMVHQEGKQNTSNDLQINRYFYMKSIKHHLYLEDNMTPWKKLTMIPRSRLHAFILKKMLLTHLTNGQAKEQPSFFPVVAKTSNFDESESEVSLSYDRISNLKSWITHTDCPSFEHAVNISYLGVIHNKDELNKDQAMFKVFEKIITEEMKLDHVEKKHLGQEEPDSFPGNHEFSPIFVRSCSAMFKKYLNSIGISDVEKTIYERVNKAWDKVLIEFATFKASTSLDAKEEFELLQTYDDDVKKAIEQVRILLSSHLKGEIRSIQVLKKVLELVEKNGVKVAIFKKQQIGGTREICILDMASRILINFLETTSRVICEMSEIEMMTKKKKKTTLFQGHYKKVSDEAKSDDLMFTISNSNDCSTWCQKFVMPVFANMTQGLVDFDFHVVICRILNCVTDKKLLLPSVMLAQFHSNVISAHGIEKRNMFNFNSPGIYELKRQSQTRKSGNKENSLIQPGNRYMNNLSNMMQGILHYTSSMLHSAVMHTYQWMIQMVSQENTSFKANRLFSTIAVSSDDSASLITLICKKASNDQEELLSQCVLAKTFLLTLSKMAKYLYPRFSAIISPEKSDMDDFSGKVEFNSLFIVKNTLISPILKFVYAAVTPKVSDSISGRLDIWGNLRMQLLSNGGSFGLISRIQICQAYAHYQCFGSGISEKFPEYRARLKEYPLTQFGFFTFEPDVLCGLFGTRFANYLHMESSDRTKAMVYGIFSKRNAILNEFGSIDLAIIIRMGSREGYTKFLNRNNYSLLKNKKLKEIIPPESYFRDPVTPVELNRAIYLKMYSHDAASTFSFETGVRMMHSAVYILDSACLSVLDKEEDVVEVKNKAEGLQHYKEKFSLLNLIDTMMSKRIIIKKPESNTYINMQSLLYPLKKTYDQALYRVSEMKNARLIRCEQRACKLQVMKFTTQRTQAGFNILDVCRHQWFSKENAYHDVIQMPDSEVSDLIEYFKLLYPWFKDTFEDSLKHSELPLSTFINNIKNNVGKNFTCTTLAPPYRSGDNSFSFAQLIRNNFSRNGMLVGADLEMSREELSGRYKVLRSIYNPPSTLRSRVDPLTDALADLYETRSSEILSSSNFSELTIATEVAMIMRTKAFSFKSASVFDESAALKRVNMILLDLRKDDYIFYSMPQERKKVSDLVSFSGKGELICKLGSKLFRIDLINDKISYIFCNIQNSTDFLRIWPRLRNKLFQEGFVGLFSKSNPKKGGLFLSRSGLSTNKPDDDNYCLVELSDYDHVSRIMSITSLEHLSFQGASDSIVLRHKHSSALLKFRMPVSSIKQSPSTVTWVRDKVTFSDIWANGDKLAPGNLEEIMFPIMSEITRTGKMTKIGEWICSTIKSHVESKYGKFSPNSYKAVIHDSEGKRRVMTVTYSTKENEKYFPDYTKEAAVAVTQSRFLDDMNIYESVVDMKIRKDEEFAEELAGMGSDNFSDSDESVEDEDSMPLMAESIAAARSFMTIHQATENILSARLAGSLGFMWDGQLVAQHPFWHEIVHGYFLESSQDIVIEHFTSPYKVEPKDKKEKEYRSLFQILNFERVKEPETNLPMSEIPFY